jgi:hypothetical protein
MMPARQEWYRSCRFGTDHVQTRKGICTAKNARASGNSCRQVQMGQIFSRYHQSPERMELI